MKDSNYKHKKVGLQAQAMTELATFGSVLLFMLGALVSYGMALNYQQSLQYETHYKAEQMALLSNYSKTGYGASVVAIRDKPLISVVEPYGASGITEYRATASIINSNYLMGDIEFDRGNEECNVSRMTYDMESKVSHTGDGESVQRTFTTSAFRRIPPETTPPTFLTDLPDENRKIRIKIECNDGICDTEPCDPNDHGKVGFWCWKTLRLYDGPGPDGKFEGEKGKAEGYDYGQNYPVLSFDEDLALFFLQYDLDGDGKPDNLTSVDVFPITGDIIDNKEKTLVKVLATEESSEDDHRYYRIGALKVLDSQRGELDFSFDSQDYLDGKPPQGLLPYITSETQTPNLQINKEETPYEIATNSTAERIDIVHRDIRVNPNYWDGPMRVTGGEDGIKEGDVALPKDDGAYGTQYHIEPQTTEYQQRQWDWHAPWDPKTYDWPDVEDEQYDWYDEQ